MSPEEILQNEQAHPVSLLRVMRRKYGLEWAEDPAWPMTVVRKTVESEFKVTLPEINRHKIMAIGAITQDDGFWTDWESFHFLAQSLSNNIPDPETHQSLSVAQMMVAVDIATQARTEVQKSSPEFSEEVARYIAAQALEASIWYLPHPLEFAKKFAAGQTYICRDCGNHSEVLFDDHLCDVCIERFDVHRLGSWEPNPDLIKKGWGRNTKIIERNPTEKVRLRLEKALSSDVTLQENQTDVCVAKLLVAMQFVALRRDQLKEQAA